MSIDDFFLGRGDDRVIRRTLFTDRVVERHAILQRVRETVERPMRTQYDFQRPAVNATVVSGQGGIGKSALLRKVAEEFVADVQPDVKKAVAYVDFGDYMRHDFEVVLVQVRASLAGLSDQWTAFDMAFAHYWSRKHPGVPLVRFISRANFLGEDQRAVLSDQVAATIDGVLGGTGLVSSTYKLAGLLRSRIQQSRTFKKLRENCPPFRVIVDEPDPDKVIGYLPALLSYDLDRVAERRRVQVLCLLDTLESVQRAGVDRGSLEDLVCRLVYLTPGIAYVLASRAAVTWYDDRSAVRLAYGGADRWPDLQPGRAGQLRIGGLDARSADELLSNSLEVEGRPAMPPAVRERVIHGSNGLPLHLELSITWYRTLLAQGASPPAEQVAETFPELVLRVVRDLSSEERDLLRSAALLKAFSAELLAEVLPGTRAVHVQAFLQRSFVIRTPHSWLPYSLHENLRQAVIRHDELTDDSWTGEERSAHAERAADWLIRQALPDPHAPREPNQEQVRRMVAAVLLAGNAALEHRHAPGRLGELAFAVAEFGYTRAFESMPAPPASVSRTPLGRLLSASRVLAATAYDEPARYAGLRECTTFGDDPYDRYVAAQFARAAEVSGDYPGAERAYRSLVDADSPLAYYGALGLAGNALRNGRLATALALAPHEADDGHQSTARCDLLGHIHLQGGDHPAAAEWFTRALDEARRLGAPVWVARGMRHQAIAYAWYDADRALALLPEAREMNESLDERIGVAQCDLAAAVAWAWKGDWLRAGTSLRACWSHGINPVAIGHTGMIEILFAQARGDRQKVTDAADAIIAAQPDASERRHVWLAVSALWAERGDLGDFEAVEWYDSAAAARARWTGISDRMATVWRRSHADDVR
ncbi:tetratricopeptide repeat protein [Streptomyces mangrovisoli]|uniref:Orc1-like AAA ATPase domain-containing protein n=1 Tax=Streptomyces mangrovisoli TaxID=1428628 RepID=A0A1J4NUC1_9ACTN|nr:hypothetical protein [Streptomyces mangrovisoli]OIJ66089.1 hypothetical protein WN71_020745 [Streptomyces mangrovisoli]